MTSLLDVVRTSAILGRSVEKARCVCVCVCSGPSSSMERQYLLSIACAACRVPWH
eukprot:COSAG01_NODE_327_length_18766_cov_84.941983_5_plen_55_part_00